MLRTKEVFLCLVFLSFICPVFAIGEKAVLAWNNPSLWKSDGGWQVSAGADNTLVLTADGQLRHNKIALLRLDAGIYRGYEIKLRCKMSPKKSNIEIALGMADDKEISELSAKSNYSSKMAESWTLRGLDTEECLNFTATITTGSKVNTIAIVGLGMDPNVVFTISDLSIKNNAPVKWFTWQLDKKLNTRVVERSPAQDYFPFGFYFPVDTIGNYMKATGITDRNTAVDEVLKDISIRGCNYVFFINFPESDIQLFHKLCKKYNLRYTLDFGETNPKSNPWEIALKAGMKYVSRERDNKNLLTWAFGEEYPGSESAEKLCLFHEMVHAIDPEKTVSIIHNSLTAAISSFNRDDVRIAFRDSYPFYKLPQCGPVSYPAQINYYENELNTYWKYLPAGASLWAMPQACHDYLPADYPNDKGPLTPYIQIENKEQIRIQAWAALGMGCTGVVYFYYGVPYKLDSPPGYGLPDGVLDSKGRPTFMLDEITDLAGKLVPVGPIIARLERTTIALSANHPELRAYLFRHIDDDKAYIIAYNRSITEDLSGQIKVPFKIGSVVNDIVNKKYITTENSELIPLGLRAGDGAIISLDITVPVN